MKLPKDIFQILPLLASVLFSSCSNPQEGDNTDLAIPVEIAVDQSICNRIVDPELIKQFGIKELVIENCLDNSQCYRNKYVFNDCGEIETFIPAMVSTYWQYAYDQNCKLISRTGGGFVRYDYTYLEDDTVQEDVFDITSEGKQLFTNRRKFKEVQPANEYELRSAGSEIHPDTIGKLFFPCGIEYHGPHKLIYNFYANGLIKSIQYFDPSNIVVVEEAYYYKGKDGGIIEFES
jgi:hypothetical protein